MLKHATLLFSLLFSLLLFLLGSGVAAALQIRSYDPALHNRFVNGSGGLELNPTAYYDASLYTGVGYETAPDTRRQYALITPEHIVLAKHFQSGSSVSFLNTDNTVITRSIGEKTAIPNGSGGFADVMIAKLSTPMTAADKIAPFPYLKLNAEAQYNGKVVVTFGNARRAGRGVITGFQNISSSNAQGVLIIESTRTMTYTYSNAIGDPNDAYAQGGDSGSPTFVIENGKPALVGIHSAVATVAESTTMFDGFVPHYDDEINAALASEGYQLIPANPAPVTLGLTQTSNTLKQALPGSTSFSIVNSSTNDASNVTLRLTFATGAVPDSVSASGWVVVDAGNGQFHLRRASLAGKASSEVIVSYNAVPVVTEISVQAVHDSDGSSELTTSYNLPVEETYAGYVAGLIDQAPADDPDGDRFPNLLEYAFGGDPTQSATVTDDGIPLNLQFQQDVSEYTFSFPRRTDAVARGLGYEVQFSDDLTANSFSPSPPSGYTSGTAAYDPPVNGFEKFTGSFPVSGIGKKFISVSITLNE